MIGIVGAGPAGSRLAQILGKKTVMFNSRTRKPCAGGITHKSKLNIPDSVILAKMGIAELRYMSNSVEFKIPDVLSVSRDKFNEWMIKEAVSSGAELVNERVIDVYKADKWVVKTNGGEYRFDFLVGADGVSSIVRRKTIGPHRTVAVTISGDTKNRWDNERMILWFFPRFLGYAWMFPKGKRANIGIGGISKMTTMYAHFNDLFGKVNFSGWAIPFYLGRAGFNDFALIGDAAGHANPISGEGVSYAIMGAEELGKAILEGKPERYEDYWRNRYGKELASNLNWYKLAYKFIPVVMKKSRFLERAFTGIIRGDPIDIKNITKWML